MKAKVAGGLIVIKRVLLVSLTLWALSTVWKLEMLRQRGRVLAQASAKILELRLASIEEKMGKTAAVFEEEGGQRIGKAATMSREALQGLLTVSSYMDEVAWVAGNGRESFSYVRLGKKVLAKAANSTLHDTPLFDAHHKGQVVISSFEYAPKKIPFFRLSYPLNGREGGFLLSRINLWEFLKLPAEKAQDLLDSSFDFELRDSQNNLLAHRVRPPDPLGKLAARLLSSRAEVRRLGVQVQLTPTKQALLDTLKPGRLIWYCLGLAIVLCFLL